MSKSYRKHPFSPITTAVSEKQDKRLANRKLRRIARECLKQGKEPPHLSGQSATFTISPKTGVSVFPLPVIRIFYANRKQGNRPVFPFRISTPLSKQPSDGIVQMPSETASPISVYA